MRNKIYFLFIFLSVLLISCGLIIQPAHSSIQDLPFSDSTTLLFNNSYEKTISYTPSSNPSEKRTGIVFSVILYNGSVYLELVENTTNSTIGSFFLNFSFPVRWKEYIFEVEFGIYTFIFLNNESLNAIFSFIALSSALWIDFSFYYIPLFILLSVATFLGIYLYLKRKRKN